MDEPLIAHCTNHCGACGRHFSSLDAFDLHKEHDETGWPHCLDPLDLQDQAGHPRLEAKHGDGQGQCNIYEHQTGVTVWATAGSHEKYLQWLARREAGTASVGSSQAR